MDKREHSLLLYRFIRFTVRLASRVFFRLQSHNIDNVPREGGLMLVSNHASNLDPPLVGCCLPRPVFTLAKAEVARIPILGPITTYGCFAIPIRRGGVDRRAMKKCAGLMKEGHMVSLFPEGTRTRDGELQPGKPGVAMLAVQSKMPCVPAYIDGAFRAWPRTRWYPLPLKIDIYYGKPFDLPERPEGMSSREHYQLCVDEMMRRIAALKPGATESGV